MNINYQKIYEQLGNLFYCIAAADNNVKPQEVAKLKEIIDSDWLPLEDSTDEFGVDAAHYIFITFDYQLAESATARESFKLFADYYKAHKSAFSKDMKRKISSTATTIANSFGGTNKSELTYLTQLQKLFK